MFAIISARALRILAQAYNAKMGSYDWHDNAWDWGEWRSWGGWSPGGWSADAWSEGYEAGFRRGRAAYFADQAAQTNVGGGTWRPQGRGRPAHPQAAPSTRGPRQRDQKRARLPGSEEEFEEVEEEEPPPAKAKTRPAPGRGDVAAGPQKNKNAPSEAEALASTHTKAAPASKKAAAKAAQNKCPMPRPPPGLPAPPPPARGSIQRSVGAKAVSLAHSVKVEPALDEETPVAARGGDLLECKEESAAGPSEEAQPWVEPEVPLPEAKKEELSPTSEAEIPFPVPEALAPAPAAGPPEEAETPYQ